MVMPPGTIVGMPAELAAAVVRQAAALGVPAEALLIAAHARVLAALTGDDEVVVAVRGSDGRDSRRQVHAGADSWRDLVRGCAQPATAEAPADTLLDLSADQIRVMVPNAGDARLAGYHRAALEHLVADPAVAPRRAYLLDAAEHRFQLDDLAGPRRPIPDRRAHELFEARVRSHPQRPAVVHGGAAWTYGEINARANRLARAVRARGIGREDVVAVVTERTVNWLVAVLATFKAGAVYLPIEPGFPPERIAAMLERTRCRLALTEQRREDLATTVLDIDEAVAGQADDSDLGVPVDAGQLAYIYFTSGSTGSPKGAMCEHAGLLNHLLAKIEDLGLGEESVVAQTAPQCFDISLWQLVAPLLTGGRTLLVDQAAILDVGRYLDTIVDGGVDVLQAVPSYLDVVLTHLEERPRPLGRLRVVSATGEALKRELVERWFRRCPGVTLVNAYGLTETSDDTNHEVLTAAPDGPIPLGPPVRNVVVYVVDEFLRPVPFGAPGEIVFSGVCVGRGYVNDPERTAAAFGTDPHRDGERLYRSGDFGRWRPDGKLEFLGRRDAQVKVRGFRIELGEIESRLLRVPGIRDAAVVVVTGADGQRQLAGFYQAGAPVTVDQVRAALARTLADYMVPSQLRELDRLPLTGNGKVDRKALRELAPAETAEAARPAGPTQQRIAAAWETALRLPAGRVCPADDFFAIGGTSLAALRMIVDLDRLFSLPDLVEHPVLRDLAELIDAREAGVARPAAPVIIHAGGATQEDWVAENRALLRRTVEQYGAVLIRGLPVTEPADLAGTAARLGLTPMPHREGFAARDAYGGNVFSSAEWPPDQPMCMHHENSYCDEFPGMLAIACLTPPASGGVTGLADAALMTAELPADLVESFDRRGWQLIRNYTGMIGVDWREAFGVTDRAGAEQYCRAHGIDFRWRDDGSLTTRQHRPAVLRHPVSGERTWFNQIAFLNEWTLDPTIREYLLYEFGPDGLPFNTSYGDGEPIDEAVVKTINAAYEKLTVRTPWQAGDVLLVDNLRMAHSREAYEGDRRIAMLLADPVRRGDE